MFEFARLKLTAWYLTIIMAVSILFSIVVYNTSTHDIQRLIFRLEAGPQLESVGSQMKVLITHPNAPLLLEELYALKHRSLMTLVTINIIIFFLAGGAGYFLAGRTLHPIKVMVEEQNDFISNASHELRTPLATLRAELEGRLLEKKISDRDARYLIQSNLEEVNTLQELSNQLLRMTQLHNHQHQHSKQTLSLTEVVLAARKKVSLLAKQRKITMIINIQDFTLQGHPHELTEVFTILLDNAIKYSPQNTEISVSSHTHKGMVIIDIADQGIGIDKKDLAHIFERFYRADKSRSQADGFGLGLSIAKKIVASHGGAITVRSQIGKGSTFRVKLPVEQ